MKTTLSYCDLCGNPARSDIHGYVYTAGITRGGGSPDRRLDLCTECYGQLSLRLTRRGTSVPGPKRCYCGARGRTYLRLSQGGAGWDRWAAGYLYSGALCGRHSAPVVDRAQAIVKRRAS